MVDRGEQRPKGTKQMQQKCQRTKRKKRREFKWKWEWEREGRHY